ncbi:hypothetical protein [Methylobacterium platani]|uniref:Uncharacterized protein n=2 Tax=Methylobacterium platani TaxID=427683 RepID=A0A179S596_9HYPH|nr:hypothetical protein [Methylobacterium platani]KMO20638.1 hypothetical protein SQ03_05265 [Methylobacterium platani JCM 14648]OAS22209.1 hypothetical protein A5481_19770 [Methylobacterium platani]
MAEDKAITILASDRPISGSRLDQLIRWYDAQARSEDRLADELAGTDLTEAAARNRSRARAHRDTVLALSLLQPTPEPPAPEFRGHLTPRERPRAQVRAPP